MGLEKPFLAELLPRCNRVAEASLNHFTSKQLRGRIHPNDSWNYMHWMKAASERKYSWRAGRVGRHSINFQLQQIPRQFIHRSIKSPRHANSNPFLNQLSNSIISILSVHSKDENAFSLVKSDERVPIRVVNLFELVSTRHTLITHRSYCTPALHEHRQVTRYLFASLYVAFALAMWGKNLV